MGDGAADELENHQVPPPEPVLEHLREEMASLPVPDELSDEIFLRIPNPADLVRASAACVSFRRLIADRAFLRRYRKLHAPPLLGFLEYGDNKVFHPVAPPHPTAPAASAAALAADFSFSFLPAPASDWLVQDIRDGRVLLDRAPQHDTNNRHRVVFPEVVVCDPLYRQYLLLPPIPDDLAALVENPLHKRKHRYCETFLAPPADGGEAPEEISFRVVWMAQCKTKLVASVFSSSTGQWRPIPSRSWSDLFAGLFSWAAETPLIRRQYAYGCFYWLTDRNGKLLVLDTRRMEFSISESPPEARCFPCVGLAIVEAGEGMPGMFVRAKHTEDAKYIIRRNNCGSSSQWQLDKTISLGSRYLFTGSTGRHLFVYSNFRCFSLDFKTFQLETVFASNSFIGVEYAYSNFPPSLSTPTVASGFEEVLEQGVDALQAEGTVDGHPDECTADDADAGGQADVLRAGDGAD